MPERFFSITTDLKRAKLDDAWDAAPAQANTLRDQLRQMVSAASAGIDATGGIFSSASNGHSASAYTPGSNQAGAQEFLEMWQSLLDLFDQTRFFLTKCSTYGLDAWSVYFNGFPDPLPAPVPNPVIVDTDANNPQVDNKWLELCNLYSIGPQTVIGQVVGDEACYLWMKNSLFPVVEYQGDYTWLRITPGPQYA